MRGDGVWSSVLTLQPAQGRNVELIVPIADALNATDITDRPTGAVKFFFAGEKTPKIIENRGSYFISPRTGAAGRTDQRACHEALLWTLVHLEKRAQAAGANAVVNIVSQYRNRELASTTEFACRVGSMIVMAPLRGDLVRIAE